MTREDIIRMAREAGASPIGYALVFEQGDIERFAALVAAAEREACARLAEECMEGNGSVVVDVLKDIAELIRARGGE